MSADYEQLKKVVDGASETFKKFGFEQTESEKENEVLFTGENGVVRLVYEDEKLTAFSGTDTENPTETPKRILLSLLPDGANEKETAYVVGELKETLSDKYGTRSPIQNKAKTRTPQTVSKAAVKNGSFYDPNTLASKLCLVFPELRELYKLNVSTYGDFMPEEFFSKYGTPKIIEAIKQNNPATMKKMFQILNEIYEDGTNDTQSLIAVSILGQLGNDQILLARCVDYMSETMAPPVIEVNKYLATRSGKRAKAKLDNPPAYKPKKNKKGLMDKMMDSASLGQQ
ncbi:MAG: hypothetical protein ACI4GY_04475 [Acutalibacteraceae bacterium]